MSQVTRQRSPTKMKSGQDALLNSRGTALVTSLQSSLSSVAGSEQWAGLGTQLHVATCSHLSSFQRPLFRWSQGRGLHCRKELRDEPGRGRAGELEEIWAEHGRLPNRPSYLSVPTEPYIWFGWLLKSHLKGFLRNFFYLFLVKETIKCFLGCTEWDCNW